MPSQTPLSPVELQRFPTYFAYLSLLVLYSRILRELTPQGQQKDLDAWQREEAESPAKGDSESAQHNHLINSVRNSIQAPQPAHPEATQVL